MSKEIKSLNVAPSQEEATINHWQSFGWELKSTQEVKTQDVQTYTGQSSDGATKYYETKKGEHYIKLTFEREKSNPNYAELCELEQKYDTIQIPDQPYGPIEPEKKKPGCWTYSLSGFVMFWGIGAIAQYKEGVAAVIGGIGLIIVGIAIFVITMKLMKSSYAKKSDEYSKEHAEWEIEYKEWEKKRDEVTKTKREIIERATSLLQ